MELTEEQIKLLDERRCFKCKAKKTKAKVMGPFGMMDSYSCKICLK